MSWRDTWLGFAKPAIAPPPAPAYRSPVPPPAQVPPVPPRCLRHRTPSPPKYHFPTRKPPSPPPRVRSWHLRTPSPPPPPPVAPPAQLPVWRTILPGAAGLWSMITTLRAQGNSEVANTLEAAAVKQAEGMLATQAIMADRVKPVERRPATPPKRYSRYVRYETPPIEPRRWSMVTPSPSPEPLSPSEVDNDSQYSWVSESDWDSDWEEWEDAVEELPEDPVVTVSPPSPSPSLSPSPPTPPPAPTIRPLMPSAAASQNPLANYYNRLSTYERSTHQWMIPSPAELSEAGFYFKGPRDNVQCFSCEICQNYWKAEDDPWVRHTRRSPSCDYIVETRGRDFIDKIVNEISRTIGKAGTTVKPKNDNELFASKMKNGQFNTAALLKSSSGVASSSGWRLDPYKEKQVSTKGQPKAKPQ